MPRTPEQIAADQAFLEKARSRSPKFPDIAEALERQRQLREVIAARCLFVAFIGGLLYGIFVDGFGFVAAAFSFVGFVLTCVAAGSRQHRKSNGGEGGQPLFF